MSQEWPKQSNNLEDKPLRRSGIMRVINAGNKEKEVLDEIADIYNKQITDKYEREKTDDEIELIKDVNQKMFEFVPKFGGTPIAVKPENIHLANLSKMPDAVKGNYKGTNGFYCPEDQSVAIFLELEKNRNVFTSTLVHEILHFNSFQSARSLNGRGKMNRVGLKIYSEKNGKLFFDELEEAIICELTVRFCSGFLSKEGMDDLEKRYKDTTNYLWIGIDNIFNENRSMFKDREEIFMELAKASFGGSLKNVAKLMEKTLGEGSFREVAERTSKKLRINGETK